MSETSETSETRRAGDLVTVTIAAARFAVARRTVLRWIHAGTLPASRYPSGQWRVSSAVRGLLCAGCNLILGVCHDSPDHLRACIAYLGKWA